MPPKIRKQIFIVRIGGKKNPGKRFRLVMPELAKGKKAPYARIQQNIETDEVTMFTGKHGKIVWPQEAIKLFKATFVFSY